MVSVGIHNWDHSEFKCNGIIWICTLRSKGLKSLSFIKISVETLNKTEYQILFP